MKSKSFDFTKSPAEQQKMNKTFDFVGLYKSAAETNVKLAEKRKSAEALSKESPKHKVVTLKRERSPNKNRKRHKQEHLDISQITIDGSSLNAGSGRSSPARDTSTPMASGKSLTQSKVKSIMKNTSLTGEHDAELTKTETPITTRSKKRNKSVSFMLEDHEEVVVKKTKSDDSLKVDKTSKNLKDKKKNVKIFKRQQSEKENKGSSVNNQNMEVGSSVHSPQEKKPKKMLKVKKRVGQAISDTAIDTENPTQDKNKKIKKVKKQKSHQSIESGVQLENNNNEVATENKTKKMKKKKHQMKPPIDTPEARGEPASKSRKIDVKPDIAEDLENLSIGDNAHTLTNLLDEMTVVDKDKHKKLRQKLKKNKKPKTSSPEPGEENSEVKEKVKWKRRKWNRDKKGDISEDNDDTSLIVENLPLSIMLNYKKLLSEHFVKYGLIKKIGIAEVYPTEESKPVFTTTITFNSDRAAEQALDENNAQFQGARIRVKRALPATQTTVVVRSYAELSDQALSSAFLGAGRIRSIRHLVKGKKTIGTAFVEFDGPESVERAIKKALNARIGGKKIHVAKFEVRAKKQKKHKGDGDSAVEADSEDSND